LAILQTLVWGQDLFNRLGLLGSIPYGTYTWSLSTS